MTDPQSYVADQIGQHADDVRAAAETPDLAEQVQASSGLGVTEADLDSIKALIADMQSRLDAAERARAADAPPVLVSTVRSLQAFLEGHGDPAAVELGKDLHEAATNATESGDTSHMATIATKLAKHLARNAPYPGENYHYKQAADWAHNHIFDAIDSFVPAPKGTAVASNRAPVKVVEGSVVG